MCKPEKIEIILYKDKTILELVCFPIISIDRSMTVDDTFPKKGETNMEKSKSLSYLPYNEHEYLYRHDGVKIHAHYVYSEVINVRPPFTTR